ncbi:MAG: hypothetical protein F2789_05375 [Actinobacteria bacterium]|nr:hypothetical protein [Actinomycetota bacterium]
MSFLDKAKEKATQLTQAAKEKVDDIKDDRKVDDLLDDIGRIIFRQRTEGAQPDDDATIDGIVAQLKELDAKGANVLDKPAPPAEPASAPAPEQAATLPPPPPPPAG